MAMSRVLRHDRQADEVALINEIVARHPLPPFVTGYDVRLGEFDGDPALWVEYKLNADITSATPDRRERLDALERLRKGVQGDLLDAFDERFPSFRFKVDPALSPPVT